MIFIYKNRGILIPVYLFVSVLGIIILNGLLKEYIGGFFSSEYDFQIVLGIGLLISFIWTYLTSYDYIEVDGEKQRIEMNNHFFYISNRLWSYIMLGASILALAGGIIETLSK
ncbi:hypothetical protein MHL31_04195 [Lutibacter sp. A80]|uniref:hypothetical protein n=1 Tax=Lutibacter sp. A80 TaxID=2918453 RepID=UPI001F0699BE|nr:hypothetical protein [Lutibacter sp. A80]UMB61409.1 hypothetical protein MHL31_04195 [Lutibacter sp. A80]